MKTHIQALSHSVSFALFSVACASAFGAVIPSASNDDPRVRMVPYKALDVTQISVWRGVVTRIILEADEKIETPVVGLSSDCNQVADEWCIVAERGSNQVFIRPRDGSIRNNMELRTNKRDYSFEFEVKGEVGKGTKLLSNSKLEAAPYYRVIFNFPKPIVVTAQQAPALPPDRAFAVANLLKALNTTTVVPSVSDPEGLMKPEERLKGEGIFLRNANYTKQVLPQGQDAEPSLVFDDGRFTYFEFVGSREIPAIFAFGSDDVSTRVNWHMQGSFVVVQRTARKFSLRLGGAIVGIFNESFDTQGVDTPTSTISSDVKREIKEIPAGASKEGQR
jgi:type IV secretion system protein VirB9